MSICYLNGEYLSLSQAKISPLDRGFMFADGVYEVIMAYQGKAFCLQRHIERLFASMNALQINTTLNEQQWYGVIKKLLDKNPHQLAYIYIQVTRGNDGTRAHNFSDDAKPTQFAYVNPLQPNHSEMLLNGVSGVTVEDKRRKECYVKSIALLDNVMATRQAIDMGAKEAILMRDGHAIEAASGNLFIVKAGVIKTTPLIASILPGVTREVVIDLARKHGVPIFETMISKEDLLDADEVWVTSTTREIAPVIEVDNEKIGVGTVGPVFQRMHAYFQEYKQELGMVDELELI